MGGQLEIVAPIPGDTVRITQFKNLDEEASRGRDRGRPITMARRDGSGARPPG